MMLFFIVSISCLLTSYRILNIQTTLTLIIFNAFFISIFFQLNGTSLLKAGMLTAGNLLGLFWNFFFQYISVTGDLYLGSTFNALFAIVYPILNLMWIVPFWSLSLSFLPKLTPPTIAVEA